MAQLFAHISVSLDGYINDSEGKNGFFPVDRSFHEHIEKMLSFIDGMVFGRNAYDLLATFWPEAEDYGDETLARQASYTKALPKYVLTHRPLTGDWSNSCIVNLEDLALLKEVDAKPIAVFAGAATIEALLCAGLLDELQLLRQPIILGSGLSLLSRSMIPLKLGLLNTKALTTGAVLETYRVVDGATEGGHR